MASKGIEIEIGLVVVLVVAMLSAGVSAQSSCLSVLVSMSPCLNYITGKTSLPSSTCCSQLALLGRSQPRCLCKILNSGGSPSGPNVNQTQALTLPSACNVPTPPFSGCNVATPTDTPVGTTPSIPSISADHPINRWKYIGCKFHQVDTFYGLLLRCIISFYLHQPLN
uniref:Bifunctional inhibitor/plant lipid transfer protein/seed storage helical domain-containing protein n=1 Tax=Nelumbo nucifera TaxID=4432 RepID=A0A822ZXF9_NELNU|nr:TPA_asm: hypothetical protein HUJ06_017836 [Nelumbo nucifera]